MSNPSAPYPGRRSTGRYLPHRANMLDGRHPVTVIVEVHPTEGKWEYGKQA